MLVIYHLFDCLPDRVVPMTNGSVQFEYDSNGKWINELICISNTNKIWELNGEELIRKIQAAQFVREHGGEVCPAGWKPGKETLKPELELVGKI